ncbi:MAG: hypothetical protein ACE14L_06540 [Terriglobales bacterium]
MNDVFFTTGWMRWVALLPAGLALLWVARSAVWPAKHERLAWYDHVLRVAGAVTATVIVLIGVAVNLGWVG